MLKARTVRKPTNVEEKPSFDENTFGLEYPHRLNVYDRPPAFDVTLEEFETAALDRLRVLAEIESSAVRGRSWEETKSVTGAHCKKYLPLHSSSAKYIDRDAERRKDILGHFVLRLAFSRSDELRRRFLKAELTLFKVRYDDSDMAEREAFSESRNFNWVKVDDEEKKVIRSQLFSVYSGPKATREALFKQETYLKVRWTRVPDLVSHRKVFLKGGWAYVPSREQSSIIFQEFESHLEQALLLTAKSLPRLDEDTRLDPILTNLSKGFLAGVASGWNDDQIDKDHITADMIDSLSKHFPLCMQHLHFKLTKDRHLPHFGRLQYGLFLKVLGLPIDEAIAFWRRSFSKITDDEFNKKYKYNIRHSYGLEGRKANYSALSCSQILIPSNKDSNWVCPYKHFAHENLSTALAARYQLAGTDLSEVMATVKAGHPHVACTRVFEITHAAQGIKKGEGIGGGESVTHPNQYAAVSIELEKASSGTKSEAMVVG
ncbi:DNA primase, large subunit [Pleurotus eryngii]|uniref:DNA primase large subunit n=1 Tax=Pleurotus eryngii TaxID=5323 RepID=A0A9P6A8I7_PLEER|nr:DNA primase, large subunit [Pleurotus eryngii]